MSYGTIAGALSRGRHSTHRIFLALAALTAALTIFGVLGASQAGAAFKPTAWSMSASTLQAGAHPALTVSASLDAVAGDQNGDDLQQLAIDLPAGMLFNPQAVTPCATANFNADTCPASTQVGQISVSYRVAGTTTTSTGAVYSITPDSNSVINFGFVVRPTTKFQKFLFQSGRATGITTVRQGLEKDYGLSLLIPNIPRTIKSTVGTSTAMTISNISITFNPRAGATQTGGYFVFSPTRCEGISSQTKFTSYQGATATHASGYVSTGCNQVPFSPTFEIRSLNPTAGQPTGINATVTMPTGDQAIQPSHVKNVAVTLPQGTTVNLGTLNSIPTCSDAQLAADACPAASQIGTASVNVPFLPAPMTGSIYLTNTDTIRFGYILKGARGTVAILRGSAGVENGGVTAKFETLPQVPWSSANLEFSAALVNNPTYACPYATAWAYLDGYSGSSSIYGAMYSQYNCPPPDTTITTLDGGPINTATPSFYFTATPSTGATFKCKIDTAAWTVCASPFTTPALADGQHTLAVRACNSAGTCDYTPATRKFTIDTVDPVIDITSPTAGQVVTTPTGDVKVEFTTEAGSVNYCHIDQGGFYECESGYAFTNLASGSHKIRIISRDLAGNIAYLDRTFTVQRTVPPTVTIQSPAQNATFQTNVAKFDFTVTSPTNTPITKITCNFVLRYDWGYEQEEFSEPCTSGKTFSMDAEVSRRVYIVAEDANGLVGTAFVDFSTGMYPPYAPGINENDAVDAGRLTDRTPEWRLYDRDGGRWPDQFWECSIAPKTAPADWKPCGGPDDVESYKVETPLTNGNWRFQTRSTSGNVVGVPNTMDFSVGDWGATYSMAASTTQAGAHPDLDVTITPNKAGQWRSVDFTLPKGLIGSLNSFPQCPLSEVPAANCDPSTKIGEVITKVQITGLTSLRPLEGDVYLTEPLLDGDVAGMVINVFSPVEPFADTIIQLRMQLIDNVQTLRIFSDEIPTQVGDIDDPEKWTNFWVNDFKMHINGSAGDPYPLLTNPTRCAPGNYSADFGDTEGNKTGVQTIAYQATGCDALPFAPTITQDFTEPVAGKPTGVYTNIELPAGNASLKTVKVSEPQQFGPFFDSFGSTSDRCSGGAAQPGGLFNESLCPPYAIVGSVSVDTPLLPYPLEGQVYLINNQPLPYLGVALDAPGIRARFFGATDLVKVNPACTGTCLQRIQVVFDNLPDLPLTAIRMDLTQESRSDFTGQMISSKLFRVADRGTASCVPSANVDSVLTPGAGLPPVSAQQAVSVSGC